MSHQSYDYPAVSREIELIGLKFVPLSIPKERDRERCPVLRGVMNQKLL
jgi:hypothetical protein